MGFPLIFSMLALLYVLLVAGLSLLLAKRHGWINAVVKAGTSLVLAIVSVPLAKLIAGKLAGTVENVLLPKLGTAVNDLMASVPVADEGMEVLIALLMAPVVYLILYPILRGLMAVVFYILEKKVPMFKTQGPYKLTLPLGAANGFLIAIATLIPVCGMLALGGTALDTLAAPDIVNTSFVQKTVITATKSSEDKLEDMADDLGHNAAVTVVHKTVGRPMFKWMTTAKLDESTTQGRTVKMTLENEFCSLLEVAGHATEMASIVKRTDHTEEDRERLVSLSDTLLESDWVQLVAADAIVELAESWQDGEDFAGIKCPTMDPALEPTYDAFLDVLSTETYDTIEEDLHVIVDTAGEILMADLFNTEATYNDMVIKLGKGPLLSDVTVKLEENERMVPVAVELKSLSMRLVTKMLGVDALRNGEHAELVGKVANSLTNAMTLPEEERREVIIESVRTSFGDSGYEVPDDVAFEISNQIIADLGADGEITQEELNDYMIEHADDGELLGDTEQN